MNRFKKEKRKKKDLKLETLKTQKCHPFYLCTLPFEKGRRKGIGVRPTQALLMTHGKSRTEWKVSIRKTYTPHKSLTGKGCGGQRQQRLEVRTQGY